VSHPAFFAGIPAIRLCDPLAVDLACHARLVPGSPEIPALRQACLDSSGDQETRQRFGLLWQKRVRRLRLDHAGDPCVFSVQLARPG